MVERWLQKKPNPYMGSKVRTHNVVVSRPKSFGKVKSAHYGKPIQLFKDSDKDGVMNVFDCSPFNRKKQDVISPFSGGNPMNEMYARQEQSRQQKEYERMLKEMQRLEEARLKELQRLSNVEVIDRTVWYADPYVQTDSGGYASVSSKEGKEALKSDQIAKMKTVDKAYKDTLASRFINKPTEEKTIVLKKPSILQTVKERVIKDFGYGKGKK